MNIKLLKLLAKNARYSTKEIAVMLGIDEQTVESEIKEMEDKYYKQFTAMETAMSKLQSQQNSLASLLGQASEGED